MKQKKGIAIVLAWLLTMTFVATAEAEIKIDRYEVKSTPESTDVPFVFTDFSIESTDFGKMKKQSQIEAVDIMKNTAPSAFRDAFLRKLAENGTFASVEALEGDGAPDGALLVRGEFTALNPGSRAKRYMVGMGAGRSKICIAGNVANAAGEVLVKFQDCRSGNLGWFGGRSEGMMSQDVYLAASNLADFVTAWAENKLPTLVTAKRPE